MRHVPPDPVSYAYEYANIPSWIGLPSTKIRLMAAARGSSSIR